MDEPQYAQEDLKDSPDAVKVSGTIRCDDGNGPYRVRVFVPPPSEGGPEETNEGQPPGPLAAETFASAGPFELFTPKGSALKLLAYEDVDENDEDDEDDGRDHDDDEEEGGRRRRG